MAPAAQDYHRRWHHHRCPPGAGRRGSHTATNCAGRRSPHRATSHGRAFRRAAGIVREEVRPISDHRASADHRRRMSGVAAVREVCQAAGLAPHGEEWHDAGDRSKNEVNGRAETWRVLPGETLPEALHAHHPRGAKLIGGTGDCCGCGCDPRTAASSDPDACSQHRRMAPTCSPSRDWHRTGNSTHPGSICRGGSGEVWLPHTGLHHEDVRLSAGHPTLQRMRTRHWQEIFAGVRAMSNLWRWC